MYEAKRIPGLVALFLILTLALGGMVEAQGTRFPQRGLGNALGAAGALVNGKRNADEILAGTGIGGVVGAAIATYMDRQQERCVRIPGTAVQRMGDDTLLIHFSADSLFDPGSADLDPAGRSALNRMAEVINDYRKTAVVVQGHTDTAGVPERSRELSEQRADSVRRYLVRRGVEPERISAVGYGDDAPVASNQTELGRSRNRRVDVLLKAKSGSARDL
jgi:outer membrane protein OmpA-like peptidoglycan-associated protein